MSYSVQYFVSFTLGFTSNAPETVIMGKSKENADLIYTFLLIKIH